MRKLLIGVLAFLSFAVMAGENVVITTGQQGLTYNSVYGVNLAGALAEFGNKSQVVPSKGSLDNLDKVAANEAQVGFTQADAFQFWRAKHPNEAQNVDIVGQLARECVWVAVKQDGKIGKAEELTNGAKIAVGEPDSGSYASWQYLQQLVKEYGKAETYAKGGIRSLAKVATGEYDAFLWVSAPGKPNKFLDAVNQDGSGLKLIDMSTWNVNDKLPNGQSVYTKESAKVNNNIWNSSVDVPCTTTLVVANNNSSEDLLEAVSTILLKNQSRILGTAK